MNKYKKIVLIFILICIPLFIMSCKPKGYTGKFFSYPPDSQPHEKNWKYRGHIKIVSNKGGAFSKKTKKQIHITIIDKDRNYYLDDKLEFECGGIETILKWDDFERLSIDFNEVGSEFVDDEYNRKLLRDGQRNLIKLYYHFDSSLGKFLKNK